MHAVRRDHPGVLPFEQLQEGAQFKQELRWQFDRQASFSVGHAQLSKKRDDEVSRVIDLQKD